MEAIGAASAILSFLSFTTTAITQIYELYHTYKDASDTVFRTTRDLRDLMRILEQILDIVNAGHAGDGAAEGESPRAGHARALEELLARDDNPVAACRVEVSGILKLMRSSLRVTWPLRKKDVETHLANIERLKSQIGLAVQSQSMFVKPFVYVRYD